MRPGPREPTTPGTLRVPPPGQTNGPARGKPTRRWPWIVVAIVVASLLIAILAFRALPIGSGASCGSAGAGSLGNGFFTFTVLPCGTLEHLNVTSYLAYQLPRLSDDMRVTTEFNATAVLVVFILDAMELTALNQSAPGTPPSSYEWSSGNTSSGSVNQSLPGSPAQFYLVFDNLNRDSSVTVRIVQPLLLTYYKQPVFGPPSTSDLEN